MHAPRRRRTATPTPTAPPHPQIIFVGASGVGKTSLLERLFSNKFELNTPATIGACARRLPAAAAAHKKTARGRPTNAPRRDALNTHNKLGIDQRFKRLTIDGRAIERFEEVKSIVSMAAGQTLTLAVKRGGETLSIKAVPPICVSAPTIIQPANAPFTAGRPAPVTPSTTARNNSANGSPNRKRTSVAPAAPSLPVNSRCMALRAVWPTAPRRVNTTHKCAVMVLA